MESDINPDNFLYLDALSQESGELLASVGDLQITDKIQNFDVKADVVSKRCLIEKAIEAYRMYGYLQADFNPLVRATLCNELTLEALGFTQSELKLPFPTGSILPEEEASLNAILNHLKSVYANKVGIEYASFCPYEIKEWIKERFEPLGGRAPLGKEQKRHILKLLVQAETFETFLHTKYVGQKRFSLEGAETLIPMLAFFIERSCQLGVEKIILGMAHRGRLNVLANICGKPIDELLLEFEDNPETIEDAGDVKYHKGYSSTAKSPTGKEIPITMVSNPSHLESVDAVVEGFVKGLQTASQDDKQEKVIPILIHGDASLSGQGVIYETLQLSRLAGYSTGGTIHIILNNQIGFTANPEQSRSTKYCSDIAKTFGFPVFHVNAEDPEMCVWIMICALEMREQLHTDVFIDVNCYRKHGHNESDEPAFTQPLMYDQIKMKSTIYQMYKELLLSDGIQIDDISNFESSCKETLNAALDTIRNGVVVKKAIAIEQNEVMHPLPIPDLEIIKKLGFMLYTAPADFNLHNRLNKLIEERKKALDAPPDLKCLDFSFAEALAFAYIIKNYIYLRLAGQDSGRGTFSQRHSIWVDQKNESKYIPLQKIQPKGVEIVDSPLSEYAALAFEYGFSISHLDSLVLWEAQFGDFANGAQIVIDQYIAAGERKWGNASNLTLLLPHGYEGQGPEHSSARMERFLDLAAEDNIIIAAPTTPAQYFSLLLRQATNLKPLIVFTPKGLLRHPECKSSFNDLLNPFQPILVDKAVNQRRIFFCQGHIYYELKEAIERLKDTITTIIRIEQLYPFVEDSLKLHLSDVTSDTCFFWVQEEPENGGAYLFIRDYIQKELPSDVHLKYVGRQRSATPAVGSHKAHYEEHKAIMKSLFLEES